MGRVDHQRRAVRPQRRRRRDRCRPARRPTSAPTRSTRARRGGAPGRSIAASTAAVQSPSSGCRTTSTVKPCAGARVIHSSTAEEWSFSSSSTREPAGTRQHFRRPWRRRSSPRRSARHPRASALISRAAARRARSCCSAANPASIVHGRPLRATRGAPGLLRRNRQRAPGGGVEEADLARNVEQRALRWQHPVALRH